MIQEIEEVTWKPPAGYGLAIEVMRIPELRRRASPARFRTAQRAAFFVLLAVTKGRTEHVIDFIPFPAKPGSWLLVRPGQMQGFDFAEPWEGFLIIFRPDFLPPSDDPLLSSRHALSTDLEELSGRIDLPPREHAVCCASARQMRRDSAIAASDGDRNSLMLYQLYALLFRLKLASARWGGTDERTRQTSRVAKLRKLVDEHCLERRDVRWYAKAIGCSERTLTRATREVAGLRAKDVISDRAVLEAKRLLVHTRLTVQAIADTLGFDEASNFVKFFKRGAGCTPTSFRGHYTGR